MKSTAKKDSQKATEKTKKEGPHTYTDETVKNYSFSDYVKVRSNPRGMLFSFGKIHPDSDKFIIFQEILLPFDIANSLQKIIDDQFKKLSEAGLIEVRERPKRAE